MEKVYSKISECTSKGLDQYRKAEHQIESVSNEKEKGLKLCMEDIMRIYEENSIQYVRERLNNTVKLEYNLPDFVDEFKNYLDKESMNYLNSESELFEQKLMNLK